MKASFLLIILCWHIANAFGQTLELEYDLPFRLSGDSLRMELSQPLDTAYTLTLKADSSTGYFLGKKKYGRQNQCRL